MLYHLLILISTLPIQDSHWMVLSGLRLNKGTTSFTSWSNTRSVSSQSFDGNVHPSIRRYDFLPIYSKKELGSVEHVYYCNYLRYS